MIVTYFTGGLFLLTAGVMRLAFYNPFSAFDPLVCLILYCSFFRPFKEGIINSVVWGLAMDSMSVCPFGLHAIIYLGIFLLFRWLPKYIDIKNIFFLGLASALSQFFQWIFYFIIFLVLGLPNPPFDSDLSLLLKAMAWAGLLGWAIILGFDKVQTRLQK